MVKAAKSKKTKKVDRYLTEIKELPPSQEQESEYFDREKDKRQLEETETARDLQTRPIKDVSFKPGEEYEADEDKQTSDEEKMKQKRFPFSIRDIILGVINLISVALLIIVLFKLPDRAKELNKLRTETIKNESSVSFEFGEIETSKVKAEKLKALFLDESGVVDFVNEVEKLKTQGSVIKKISFASSEVIKDKTGNCGTPVAIEMSGTWEEIGKALEDIEKLPYIFRPVNISAKLKEEEQMVSFTYGGFLYVDSKLGQN